jgi:hypothetical protein
MLPIMPERLGVLNTEPHRFQSGERVRAYSQSIAAARLRAPQLRAIKHALLELIN